MVVISLLVALMRIASYDAAGPEGCHAPCANMPPNDVVLLRMPQKWRCTTQNCNGFLCFFFFQFCVLCSCTRVGWASIDTMRNGKLKMYYCRLEPGDQSRTHRAIALLIQPADAAAVA